MPATYGRPLLHRRIALPGELLASEIVEGEALRYGGDLRVGDLTGDGRADLVVYRAASESAKPVFIAACDMEGQVLWQEGAGGSQPARPGPVAVHDLDGDGQTEVICLRVDSQAAPDPGGMGDAVVQLRDGASGEVLHQATPPALRACRGEGPNWVHQRLLVANLRGLPTARDLVIKLGDTVLALDERFEVLWTYRVPWNDYGRCASYIPAVGDIDEDGRDEMLGGYYLLDWDGAPLWEKPLAQHTALSVAQGCTRVKPPEQVPGKRVGYGPNSSPLMSIRYN